MFFYKKIFWSAEKQNIGEDGYVLVTVLFIIAILTISAVAIATISQTESAIVRNERVYLNDFYASDAGISIASEKFKEWERVVNIEKSVTYEHQSETGGKMFIEAFAVDKENGDSYNIQHNLPVGLKHVDDPMISSGSGVTGEVFVRRYALSAKSDNGNVKILAGVYKYIPGNNTSGQ